MFKTPSGKYTASEEAPKKKVIKFDEDDLDDQDDYQDSKEPDGVPVKIHFKSTDGGPLKKTKSELPQQFVEVNHATLAKQLKQFVDATECVKGGRGWWKHEFCFEKYIYHLHYETNKQTNQAFVQKRIVLGVWDKNVHIEWTKSQSENGFKRLTDAKPTVVLYYGQGDICHENNQFRHTLVKLRCLPGVKGSASISISLSEPKLCSYVMIVDSGMFCDLLKNVDEYGVPVRD